MKTVDYLKLSEQYASFLVAVGGVSITVLTLVLSLGPDLPTPTEVNSRSFLVAALVVATVTCFIGASMMAETAAFISNAKDNAKNTAKEIVPGARLFLLASTNIFIAIILVLFALMLLPSSSRRVHAVSLAPISVGVFWIIILAALYWMIIAAKHRMPMPQSVFATRARMPYFLKECFVRSSVCATSSSIIIALVLGVILYCQQISNEYLLWIVFAPSALSMVISLVWFVWIFKEGDTIRLDKARIQDIWFFSLAITLSYAPLVVAGIKIVLCKQFADGEP